MVDRRSRKRDATRQGISDVATRLFIERGFDAVTIDEIAEAADVGRKTVFNHFPRKEDMFFDRDEESQEIPREALRSRGDVAPIEALRRLIHRMVSEGNPYIEFSSRSQRFVRAIAVSEALKARARAIRDEFVVVIASALAESVDREAEDPDAFLAASMIVGVFSAAFIQAHRSFRLTGSTDQARSVFLAVVDQGAVGLKAAMADTPYV